MRRVGFCLLALVASCGGYSDEGGGTGTLEVDARASYEVSNDRTDVRIDVVVTTGSVDSVRAEIQNDLTGETRTMERIDLGRTNRARFAESFAGYAQRLELLVERGDDNLDGRIEGPGRHVIDFPRTGGVVEAGDSFDLEWTVEDGLAADTVEVELDDSDFFRTLIVDSGELEIPDNFVQRGEETAEVERSNIVDLAGGVPGSTFSISYSVANEFVVTE